MPASKRKAYKSLPARSSRSAVRASLRRVLRSSPPATHSYIAKEATAVRPRQPTEANMTEPVYRVVEIVATSEEIISKAIDHAIERAAKTLRHLGWFEVVQARGAIENGKVRRYQVTLKVGFTLE